MKTALRLTIAAFGLAIFNVSAATLYVSLESTNPVAPYATWETAARVIQDAVDAAKAGDTVLVTNGVYAVGSRDVSVLDTNQHPPQLVSIGPSRVVVTNSIRLESVNGPEVTAIDGGWDGDVGSGTGVRCVYLTHGSTLSGLMLTNGAAVKGGGGVWSASTNAVLTNCVVVGNWAGSEGGGASGCTLYDCLLEQNSAAYKCSSGSGGGASGCTLCNCVLTGNSAASGGGGACASTLYNCTLTRNSAGGGSEGNDGGGGASGSTLYHCVLAENSSGVRGGGAEASTLYNCTLTGNSAGWFGGGVEFGMLYKCTLTGNWASGAYDVPACGGGSVCASLFNCVLTGNSAQQGGGAYWSWLCECTVIGNSASEMGGGMSGATGYNCIVYYNSAPTGANYITGLPPYYGEEVPMLLWYSCTTPLPTNGVGNITGPPLFVDLEAGDFRLREDSPCIDAGTNLLVLPITVWEPNTGLNVAHHITDPTDILGNTRFIDGNGDGTVAWDIGAYEFNSFKPPRFNVQPQRTSDGWTLSITGAPDKWVHVQRSSNLKHWEDIWSGFMGAEGAQQVNDSDMGQKAMFYRMVVP